MTTRRVSRRSLSTGVSRTRDGFTLVELLTVTVVIGVLASIAILKAQTSKQRAFLAAMKSDLHTLALNAETQYASDGSYANLVLPQGSAGVTVTLNTSASAWSASATHDALPGVVCNMTVDATNAAASASEAVCQ